MKKVIAERLLYDLYDDFLDEAYETVQIGPYDYSTSHALKEVDPVAYQEGFNNWIDAEMEDGRLTEEDGVYYEVE